MSLVAGSLFCYVLGVFVMVPHQSRAQTLVSSVPQVTPAPIPQVALDAIPRLWRDPFTGGLSTDGPPAAEMAAGAPGYDTTLPPVLTTTAGGVVPPITRSACNIDVLGTFLGTDAETGKAHLLARISENGAAAQPKMVGDLVCGDVLTAITFDGATVGDRHYSVDRDGGAVLQEPVTSTSMATPAPTPSASPTPTPLPTNTPFPDVKVNP